MNSKIKTFEWVILLVVAIMVDTIQIILDFFVIGAIANRIIDFIFGLCLTAYLWFRGVSMTNWKRAVTMILTFLGEQIPGFDLSPLWSLDVIVIWGTVVGEKKLAEKLPLIQKVVGTANRIKGITQPRGNRPPPLNSTLGTRPPRLSKDYNAEDEDSAIAI